MYPFPHFRYFTFGTPTIPDIYWNSYSYEERIKKLCMEYFKLIKFTDSMVDTINDQYEMVEDMKEKFPELVNEDVVEEIQNRIEDGTLTPLLQEAIDEWMDERSSQVDTNTENIAINTSDIASLRNELEEDVETINTDINSVVDMLQAPNKTVFIGHGGLAGVAPNNSPASVQKAGQYGFDCVEVDIRKTIDGVIVCSHNESIEAYLNGTGNIANMTYNELLTYKYVNGSNIADFPEMRIMSLNDCITLCKLFNLGLFIDIKDDGIASDVDALVKSRNAENMCVYIAGSGQIINDVKAIEDRRVPFFEVFTDSLTEANIMYAKIDGACGVTCYHEAYDQDTAQYLKSYGMLGIVWVNAATPSAISYADYTRCMELGINGFTVDSAEYMAPHNVEPELYSKYAISYSNKIPVTTPYYAELSEQFNHLDPTSGKLMQNKICTAYPNMFGLGDIDSNTSLLLDKTPEFANIVLLGMLKDANGSYKSWRYQSPDNFAKDKIFHMYNSGNSNNMSDAMGIDWYVIGTHSICNESVAEKMGEYIRNHMHVYKGNVACGSYSGNLFNNSHTSRNATSGTRGITQDYIRVHGGQSITVPTVTGSNVRISIREYDANGDPLSDTGWKNQGDSLTLRSNAAYVQLYAGRSNEAEFDYANFMAFDSIWEAVKRQF